MVTTSDKVTVEIWLHRLEPGTHILRKSVSRDLVERVELPLVECQEVRPDWGEYLPLTTFPAIERALRARGKLSPLGPDLCWYYG